MTEYSHCPDCSSPLGKERTKCRCGWVLPQVARQQENPNHIPCADDATCLRPGRMWVEGMPPRARVCTEHYYARIERSRRSA